MPFKKLAEEIARRQKARERHSEERKSRKSSGVEDKRDAWEKDLPERTKKLRQANRKRALEKMKRGY